MLLNRIVIAISLLSLMACKANHEIWGDATPTPPPDKKAQDQKTVSPFSYLRKLSMHLRGQTPTPDEYADLSNAIAQKQTDAFFKARIDFYLASNQHIDKMIFRLEELFSLKASPVPFYSPLANPAFGSVLPPNSSPSPGAGGTAPLEQFALHNAMNEIFHEVVTRNLSWDNLLLTKHYSAQPKNFQTDGFNLDDFTFFSQISGTSESGTTPQSLTFDDRDDRVAGILTTARFFDRYATTDVNKNRRRAAAIFRTLLCDDMKTVVVDEKSNQSQILDLVFPASAGGSQAPAPPDQQHGSDPACLKCHYKLDPMGKTFATSGRILSPLASPGALVFTPSQGNKVDLSATGVGQLAQYITQQDDYVRCQVRHFWNWFVGEDVPLSEDLLKELTAKFNEVNRHTNDFIAYLVSRNEFSHQSSGETGSKTDSPLTVQVKQILSNCNGCHATQPSVPLPSFSNWPIGGSPASHQRWLNQIRLDLSLDGSTAPRKMPPAKNQWQPSSADIATLQKWYDQGAPND